MADRVAFNIPGTGLHTIAPLTNLPNMSDPVVIDGFSQPGTVSNSNPVGQPLNASLKIELSGNSDTSAGPAGTVGIYFGGGSSTLQGLIINRFNFNVLIGSTGGNHVQGCYIGTDPTGAFAPVSAITGAVGKHGIAVQNSPNNEIGATFNSGRNLLAGSSNEDIQIYGNLSTGNVIHGNLIGTTASGSADIGTSATEIGVNVVNGGDLLASSTTTIGGTTTAERNVISGCAVGVFLASKSNKVVGNFIGTDISGTQAIGNGTGVVIVNSNHTIGGSTASARNVISGNLGAGVQLGGTVAASSNLVVGNFIGTDASGTKALGNGTRGVEIKAGSTTNAIGGVNAGDGNVIAYNKDFGVFVPTEKPISVANDIRGNSIYQNGSLGIKLDTAVPTPLPNDAGDIDSGANDLQNYPVLTSAALMNGDVTINGTLNSTPNTDFRIDFYADAGADPSGYGEGRFYLGTAIPVATDASGNASFTKTFPFISDTTVVTATANANGTSEFSKALAISGAPGHLLNIATRLRVQTGENVLISGFIITGPDNKRVIVRGLGPSLSQFGVPDALQDPVLELYASGNLMTLNDNWNDSDPAAIAATGIPPSNDFESAVTGTLAPGAYSAI
ncbi:MAG: hypothetical protein M3Z64_04365 [Verrucomicrobiota bacterium]|nr:hypothetical protein [Verrucomicrobiota bacterium]